MEPQNRPTAAEALQHDLFKKDKELLNALLLVNTQLKKQTYGVRKDGPQSSGNGLQRPYGEMDLDIQCR